MFLNREEAGIRLALRLSRGKLSDAVIIGIPRGGVVVAKSVSEILGLPLFAQVVKKIGAPHNPELAIGATGSDGVVFWDEETVGNLGIGEKERKELFKKTVAIIKKLEKSLKIKKPKISGKTVIIVDDGVATGATAIAASLILKKLGSQKVILATPVISKKTKKELARYFDKIIAVETPDDFSAVGEFYREFPQIEDEEVKEILNSKNKI